MIKKFVFILILMLIVIGKVYAQGLATGKLIDNDTRLPLQNANITVYEGEKPIYHTLTDSAGKFTIPQKFLKQPGDIKISSLNYKEIQIEIQPGNYSFNEKNIDLGAFKLTARKIELKEVVINSKKRYHDTTKIDLSKQKFDRSYMINDLFAKKFGFTKDENGQLYYKGKIVTDLVVNGGNFFGKNDMDIYQLLPALVLDNIEVTETNIDSVTNITLPMPHIKVNLKLKEQYKKGLLGNVNLGIGTAGRYVANNGLYSYKNNQQVSLSLNSNNVNISDNTIIQPKVDFSANGNNSIINTSRFTYRNLIADKIEINFAVKAKIEDKKFLSETDQQQEDANIFSKTFNSSDVRSFDIQDGNFDLLYKIDTLNTINITQSFNHSHTRESDSLNYFIKLDSSITASRLHKTYSVNNNLYNTEINYQKKFSSKKGRLLTIDARSNNNTYDVSELDRVSGINDQKLSQYFIDGNKAATENIYTINSNYTEPINDSCYINFSVVYKKDILNYNPRVKSDTTLSGSDIPAKISNDYLKPGITFQRVFNKIIFNSAINGLFYIRNIGQSGSNQTASFLNLDLNIKTDYTINKRKSISLGYTAITNYPDMQQLTSLNRSFDLITQSSTNIYLKPEEIKTIKLDYSVRPTDSENIILSGQLDHYSSVFGYRLSNDVTSIQTSKTDNLGNANDARVSFTILKTISTGTYLNYTNSISYRELPTVLNNKLQLNNGITIDQSLSTSFTVIDTTLLLSPILTSGYSKFFYQASTVNVLTLTYYDKLSFQAKGFQLNLFPLFTYNHSISNNHSFSMNGEIKKSFFKKYLSAWLKAYDIFNSFKFYNNNIGASSYQSVKYSNVERYIILGISFKFNNIK